MSEEKDTQQRNEDRYTEDQLVTDRLFAVRERKCQASDMTEFGVQMSLSQSIFPGSQLAPE